MVPGLQQIGGINENACRIHEAKKLGIVDAGRNTKDRMMKESNKNFINDEAELPSLTKDFAQNVKKHFEEKDAESSSESKSQGTYADGLVAQIKENRPHLSEKTIRDHVKSFW